MTLEKTRYTRYRNLFFWSLPVIVGLVLAQQFGEIPGDHLLAVVMQNALHVPWFAILTLVIWFVFGHRNLVWVLAISGTIGVATEAMQIVGPREASFLDLGLNLLGALIAALGIFLHHTYRGFKRKQLWSWIGVAALLVVVTLVPPTYIHLSYQHRDRLFPRLLEIDSFLQKPLLHLNSTYESIEAPNQWIEYVGSQVLKVRWADTEYPGLELKEVVSDWTCCRVLRVDLYIIGDEPMMVSTAVGHRGKRGTAAYVPNILNPGAHQLKVPLGQLGAIGRSAGAISKLIIHTSRRYAGREILIADVRLE